MIKYVCTACTKEVPSVTNVLIHDSIPVDDKLQIEHTLVHADLCDSCLNRINLVGIIAKVMELALIRQENGLPESIRGWAPVEVQEDEIEEDKNNVS